MNPVHQIIIKTKGKNMRKLISIVILVAFVVTSIKTPVYAQMAQDPMPVLPAPGVMVHLSPEFTPAILTGIVIHPENALKFDFIIYKGDTRLNADQKKKEYTKLIKYFLASLAVPDDDQWVNLSPYEKNRIIKDDFGNTEMGRDLLAQDYMLKQITASLIYPQDKLGQKFWDKVYAQAQKQFGTTNIPVNTFNKVWIVPDDALVCEKGNMAYVIKNHLKVMLEEDYLSLQKHSGITSMSSPNQAHAIGSQVVREVVLPALEKEVNTAKNFAPLRQVVSGMVLAAWYKKALKESLLGKIYMNQSKLTGVNQDPKNNELIYKQYLKAFKKGVFNFIKDDVDKYTNETISRKYFSGGFHDTYGAKQGSVLRIEEGFTTSEADQVMAAASNTDAAEVAAVENESELGLRPDKAMTAEAIARSFVNSFGTLDKYDGSILSEVRDYMVSRGIKDVSPQTVARLITSIPVGTVGDRKIVMVDDLINEGGKFNERMMLDTTSDNRPGGEPLSAEEYAAIREFESNHAYFHAGSPLNEAMMDEAMTSGDESEPSFSLFDREPVYGPNVTTWEREFGEETPLLALKEEPVDQESESFTLFPPYGRNNNSISQWRDTGPGSWYNDPAMTTTPVGTTIGVLKGLWKSYTPGFIKTAIDEKGFGVLFDPEEMAKILSLEMDKEVSRLGYSGQGYQSLDLTPWAIQLSEAANRIKKANAVSSSKKVMTEEQQLKAIASENAVLGATLKVLYDLRVSNPRFITDAINSDLNVLFDPKGLEKILRAEGIKERDLVPGYAEPEGSYKAPQPSAYAWSNKLLAYADSIKKAMADDKAMANGDESEPFSLFDREPVYGPNVTTWEREFSEETPLLALKEEPVDQESEPFTLFPPYGRNNNSISEWRDTGPGSWYNDPAMMVAALETQLQKGDRDVPIILSYPGQKEEVSSTEKLSALVELFKNNQKLVVPSTDEEGRPRIVVTFDEYRKSNGITPTVYILQQDLDKAMTTSALVYLINEVQGLKSRLKQDMFSLSDLLFEIQNHMFLGDFRAAYILKPGSDYYISAYLNRIMGWVRSYRGGQEVSERINAEIGRIKDLTSREKVEALVSFNTAKLAYVRESDDEQAIFVDVKKVKSETDALAGLLGDSLDLKDRDIVTEMLSEMKKNSENKELIAAIKDVLSQKGGQKVTNDKRKEIIREFVTESNRSFNSIFELPGVDRRVQRLLGDVDKPITKEDRSFFDTLVKKLEVEKAAAEKKLAEDTEFLPKAFTFAPGETSSLNYVEMHPMSAEEAEAKTLKSLEDREAAEGGLFVQQRDIKEMATRIDALRGLLDQAMANPSTEIEKIETPLGGIDLNAANMNLQIKRDGKGVALPISQQDIANIHIDGLIPVILKIEPAMSLPIMAQLQSSAAQEVAHI